MNANLLSTGFCNPLMIGHIFQVSVTQTGDVVAKVVSLGRYLDLCTLTLFSMRALEMPPIGQGQ
jgi:hypothetical protein